MARPFLSSDAPPPTAVAASATRAILPMHANKRQPTHPHQAIPVHARPVYQSPPVMATVVPPSHVTPATIAARTPGTHSDAMIQYLSSLLAQDGNIDGNQTRTDIETIKYQLNTITEVTRKQQALQHDRTKRVQLDSTQAARPLAHPQQAPVNTNIHTLPPSITHTSELVSPNVTLNHRSKKSRTDSSLSSTDSIFDSSSQHENLMITSVPVTTPWAPSPNDVELVNSSFDLPCSPNVLGLTDDEDYDQLAHAQLYGEMADEDELAPWSPLIEPQTIFYPIPETPIELQQPLEPHAHTHTHSRSRRHRRSAPAAPSASIPAVDSAPPAVSASAPHDSQPLSAAVSTPSTDSSGSRSTPSSTGAVSITSQGPQIRNYSGMSKVTQTTTHKVGHNKLQTEQVTHISLSFSVSGFLG